MGLAVTMRVWLLIFHLGVLGSVIALVTSLNLTLVFASAVLLLSAGPLALAINGLYAGSRYTQQWLSIAMVFYVGFGLAETIASQGQSPSAILLLLTSGIELSLLFLTVNGAATWLTQEMGPGYYGMGFGVATGLTCAVGVVLLNGTLRSLVRDTFMLQPTGGGG